MVPMILLEQQTRLRFIARRTGTCLVRSARYEVPLSSTRYGWTPRAARPRMGELVIGPVQLLMISFKGDRIPAEVRKEIKDLLADHKQVRVLDVATVVMHRNRMIEQHHDPDVLAASPRHSGDLVDRLLSGSGAAAVTGESTSSGAGYLFRGDEIPHLRQSMSPGTGAIILLLEHLWAIPLRDAVLRTEASAVTDAWIGRNALQQLELIPSQG